jgi:hypothetical protein
MMWRACYEPFIDGNAGWEEALEEKYMKRKGWTYVEGREKGCFAKLFAVVKSQLMKQVNRQCVKVPKECEVSLKFKRSKTEMIQAEKLWRKRKRGTTMGAIAVRPSDGKEWFLVGEDEMGGWDGPSKPTEKTRLVVNDLEGEMDSKIPHLTNNLSDIDTESGDDESELHTPRTRVRIARSHAAKERLKREVRRVDLFYLLHAILNLGLFLASYFKPANGDQTEGNTAET